MTELKTMDDLRALCRPAEREKLDRFVSLWLQMHRGWRAIASEVVLPLGRARRCLDSMLAAGMPRGGPEHMELTRNLADALDGTHTHFAALTWVSGELAALVHTENGTALAQADSAVPPPGLLMTQEQCSALWREMYRGLVGIGSVLQPLDRAHRLGDVCAMAAPLDTVHAHYAALARVSGELAVGMRANVHIGVLQFDPAMQTQGLIC